MGKVLIEEENLTNIANSIRSKTGATDTMTPSEMSGNIETIESVTEYFNTTITSMSTNQIGSWGMAIKKLPKFVVSNLSSLSSLYKNFKGQQIDVSGVDTTGVIDFSYMFNGCQFVTNLNLSHFNTSNVTNMAEMFYQCQRLYTLDLSNWNTSNVTNMTSIFYQCRQLTNLNLSHFDTTKMTSGYYMFHECRSLTELDVSNFNTTNFTTMSGMFAYCYALPRLDLSSFYTPNLVNTAAMFRDCFALMHLDIRNFDFSNVTSYERMFEDIPADCTIIVKDETAKTWVLTARSDLTNVKTVAEYESEV